MHDKRVLHVIATLGPGGAEAFAANLCAALQRGGTQVSLYLMAGVRGDRGEHLLRMLEAEGVAVHGKEQRSAWSLSNITSLMRLIFSGSPNVIHAHLYSAEVLVALVAALGGFPRRRLVRTLHSSNIVGTRSPWITRRLDARFGVSVACGPAVHSAYQSMYGDEYRTRLHLINNGVEVDMYYSASEKKRLRHKLGLPVEGKLIVNVAGFRGDTLRTSIKGQDVLLDAMAAIRGARTDVFLLLLGDGPLLSEAKAYAKACGIDDEVIFLGAVPDVRDYLAAADVFCLPSRYEGLPISLLEAAASGLPVAASDIPEVAALNRDFPWFLAKPCDAGELASAILDAVDVDGLDIARYRQAVSDSFDISSCGREYSRLYNEIAS